MPDRFYINPDVIMRRIGQAWVMSNPRLRTHVEFDQSAMSALIGATRVQALADTEWADALEEGTGRDRTSRGMGGAGLHADHSGLSDGDTHAWISGGLLFNLLVQRRLLIKGQDEVSDRVKALSGILDRDSLGTFHQRVGQYLVLERRMQAHWREWHDQKFSPDGKELLDTPYRALQEPFFDKFFSRERIAGRRILDFGCGNAYFTAKFADRGADVVGMDNSAALLEIARENHAGKKGLELILTRSFDEVFSQMSQWESGSFDFIYLQDTLLLLLQPEAGVPSPELPQLFNGFRRLLRPTGRLCAMEPNPAFWLANRYGNPSSPYAIGTEYRHPVFNVVPTLDQVLPVMGKAGLALVGIQHPIPDPGSGKELGYQLEFPIWDFFEFIAIEADAENQDRY